MEKEAATCLPLLPLIPPKSPSQLFGGAGGMSGSSGVAAAFNRAFAVFGVEADTSNVVTALRVRARARRLALREDARKCATKSARRNSLFEPLSPALLEERRGMS